MSSIKSGRSIDELFEEAAGILDEPDTSNDAANASPKAGKTPTTNIAELATAVDVGNGYKCIDGIPSQGVHVNPPHPRGNQKRITVGEVTSPKTKQTIEDEADDRRRS